MDKFSYLGNADINAIEGLFIQYQNDANSVDKSWQDFFKGFEFSRTSFDASNETIPENVNKEFKVLSLITGYRQRGHLFTKTNPVRQRRDYKPNLDLINFGLTENDLQTFFQAGKWESEPDQCA